MRQVHFTAWLLAILSAILQILIFPLPGAYVLSWLALAPLLVAILRARPAGDLEVAGRLRLQPATPWQGFLLAYVCGIVWYAGTCYWIFDTMTLAGWDEKACLAAISDPKIPRDVLDYFISPDNLRPRLLLPLLENPSVPESQVVKVARSAMRDTLDIILKSKRAMSIPTVVDVLKSNPYLTKEEAKQLRTPGSESAHQAVAPAAPVPQVAVREHNAKSEAPAVTAAVATGDPAAANDLSSPSEAEGEAAVSVYM